MAYVFDQVKGIALTGTNIVIDAAYYLHPQVKEIILAARGSGGHVTVLNATRYTHLQSKELALTGGKDVTLHLT